MMSVNLFSAEYRKQQKELTARRIWVIVVTALSLLIYYPIGVFVLVTRTHSYGYVTDAEMQRMCAQAVRNQIGIQQKGFVLVMILAAILALQGFDFLFHRVQLDFYESQPMSRKQRFHLIFQNGILIFTLLSAVTLLITTVVSAVFGVMSMELLLEILYEYLRIIIVFLAAYSITTLAITLSGSLPIAVIMATFFMGIEYMYAFVLRYYARIFFKTFSDDTSRAFAWGSPVYHAVSSARNTADLVTAENYTISMKTLGQMIRICLPGDLITLAVGVICYLIALKCYHQRKAEWAGKAIVFAPVRTIVKLLLTVLASLSGGLFLYAFYNTDSTGMIARIGMPVTIIGVGILSCLIFEAVLNYNIRAALKRAWQVPVTIIAALLIFTCYRTDTFGYDQYLPEASSVSSCALYLANNGDSYYEDNLSRSVDTNEYYEKHMILTDVQDVEDIVLESMDYMKKWDDSRTDYYQATVLYRMTDGRRVYRKIKIPSDINKKLMDRVFAGSEFRKGYFQVYNDDAILQDASDNMQLVIRSGYASVFAPGSLYSELRKCYLNDLEKFSFSMASTQPCTAAIEIQDFSDNSNLDVNYYVYPEFTNTIAFLKKNNIYLQEEIPVSQIRSVKVTNYYPGHDAEKEDISGLAYVNSKSKEYTDPGKVAEIMKHVVSYQISDGWLPDSYYNSQYSVEVASGQNYDSASYGFKTGEIPEFVKEDTAK